MTFDPPIEIPGSSEIERELDDIDNGLTDAKALQPDAKLLESLCDCSFSPSAWTPEASGKVLAIAMPVTEGTMNKGGVNPPHSSSVRPPSPGGSGVGCRS